MCIRDSVWCAFSLKEFEMYFCEGEVSDECPLVLIDLANGLFQFVPGRQSLLWDRPAAEKPSWQI